MSVIVMCTSCGANQHGGPCPPAPPPKVHKREDFEQAAETLTPNAERAIAGLVARVFGATLEEVAEDIAECSALALRELAQAHLAWLNSRMLELLMQKRQGRP